jgi:hypothetical protein
MKKILTLLVASAALALSSQAQTKISIDEASKHIGEVVTICDKVYSSRFLENAATQPTLLNLGGAFPNHKLTILINAKDRKNFAGKPEETYANKTVCVTGKLVDYKGKPEIVVTKDSELIITNSDGGGGEIRPNDMSNFNNYSFEEEQFSNKK